MTKKKDNDKSLQLLLRHYGLSTPLLDDVQTRMAHSYDRIYKKIVKRTSRITLIASITAGIYFLIKKTVIPISFAKIGSAVLLSAAICTGTYLIMKTGTGTVPAITPSVIIRPFTSSSLDQDTGMIVAEKLKESLNKKSGEGYAAITTNAVIKGAPWSIFGTIEKLNGKIVIIVKIIDSKSSRLVDIIEGKCNNLNEIDKTITAITRQMSLLNKE